MREYVKISVLCVCLIAILPTTMVVRGLFASQVQSNYIPEQSSDFETTEYNSLQDLIEPLKKLGLMFIDSSVYPHIPNSLNENHPYISIISQDTPFIIPSEKDVDLLLHAIRLTRGGGVSVDTAIHDAIAKAGLEDYFKKGFREITRPAREKDIIDMATRYSFPELVEKFIIYRPELLAEFQALGYFQGYSLDGLGITHKTSREKGIFDMATTYFFAELVETVFIHKPEMLAEFHEFGYFQEYSLYDIGIAQRGR